MRAAVHPVVSFGRKWFVSSAFNVQYFFEVFPKILQYLPTTVTVAFVSFLISLVFGLFMALIRQYRVKILYPLSNVYVSFFRSTPFIAQIFLLYYGMAQVFPFIKAMSRFSAVCAILSLGYGAFVGENIRAALNSVDKGQYEAAQSIGMSFPKMMYRIVIPQAARVAVPGLANSFIDLFKATSLCYTIGLRDMMGGATMEINFSYRYLECYSAVILIYWGIIVLLTSLQGRFEQRLNQAY